MKHNHRIKLPEGKYVEGVVSHKVRFGEADPMGILWHGHYWGLFERARETLWEKHGLTNKLMVANEVAAPFYYTECQNLAPALLGYEYLVSCRLYHNFIENFATESPSLHHYYQITPCESLTSGVIARAHSSQAFTSFSAPPSNITSPAAAGELQFQWPEIVKDFLASCLKEMNRTF